MRVLQAASRPQLTTQIIDALVQIKKERPLAHVWVLTATERQIYAFRNQLMEQLERDHQSVVFNLEFYNFYTLYRQILMLAGEPQRCISETARRQLIRAILMQLQQQQSLTVFDKIAHTPGLVQVLADFFYELKQNLIFPETFMRVAYSAKEQELAQLYSEYQTKLQQNQWVDREGEGWVALEVLESEQGLFPTRLDYLIVDGYDDLNPLQMHLLATLSSFAQQTWFTQTIVLEREETLGSRFSQSLKRFEQVVANKSRFPFVKEIRYSADEPLSPVLQHLVENLQLNQPAPFQGDPNTALQLVELPSAEHEVAAVLRDVKHRLLSGTRPDDLMIAVCDWSIYGTLFSAYCKTYHIPAVLHYGEPLNQNPAVHAVLSVLRLIESDFPRREMFDVLYSPYFYFEGFSSEQLTLLEKVCTARFITGKKAVWLHELATLIQTSASIERHEDIISEDAPLQWDVPALKALYESLTRFFEVLTPPRDRDLTTYTLWLDRLMGWDVEATDDDEISEEELAHSNGTLRLLDQIRATSDEALQIRDLKAVHQFKRGLSRLATEDRLVSAVTPSLDLSWAEFLSNVFTAAEEGLNENTRGRDGRVLITSITDARGLAHPHIAIVGLSEGLFPAPTPENLLLLDTERLRLREDGVNLPTQADSADQNGLFYSLITQATHSLMLTRPTLKEGNEWAESHLWRGVKQVFASADPPLSVVHQAPGSAPHHAQAVTVAELALSVADDLTQGRDDSALKHAWLAQTDYWQFIERARAVEASRLSPKSPFNTYSGVIKNPILRERIADLLGESHRWSASQFNELAKCGYYFFAKRLLGLEPLQEPEDGLQATQLGTLYHAIYQEIYQYVSAQELAIQPEHWQQLQPFVAEMTERHLATAPDVLGFRQDGVWEQEKTRIRELIFRFVQWDFETYYAEITDRRSIHQETAFDIYVSIGESRLRLRGFIDRIDQSAGGQHWHIFDYKSGGTVIEPKETVQGRNFQMLVYLLAAQELAKRYGNPPTNISGEFLHFIKRKTSKPLSLADSEKMESALSHLDRYIHFAKRGDFSVQASRLSEGKCDPYCPFHKLCRIANTSRQKPRGTGV